MTPLRLNLNRHITASVLFISERLVTLAIQLHIQVHTNKHCFVANYFGF